MFDEDCLFCKIFQRKIPAEIVYEDEDVLAFKDIRPVAKIHILFIHKNHTPNVNKMSENTPDDLVELFQAMKNYSEDHQIDQKGFRVVTNLGKDGGQSVFHTHFHFLAGERLPW